MNCKENFFGLVAEILACPPENISFSEEIWKEKKYILNTDYVFNNSAATFSVPIKNKSAECTETFKEALQGTSHEVSISWSINRPDKELFDTLQQLKNGCYHLIIKMIGDKESSDGYARYFVYSSEDGYRFEYIDNKGTLECKLSVVNINGLQRIFQPIINGEE